MQTFASWTIQSSVATSSCIHNASQMCIYMQAKFLDSILPTSLDPLLHHCFHKSYILRCTNTEYESVSVQMAQWCQAIHSCASQVASIVWQVRGITSLQACSIKKDFRSLRIWNPLEKAVSIASIASFGDQKQASTADCLPPSWWLQPNLLERAETLEPMRLSRLFCFYCAIESPMRLRRLS